MIQHSMRDQGLRIGSKTHALAQAGVHPARPPIVGEIPKGDSFVYRAWSVHVVHEHECSLTDPAGASRCGENAADGFFQHTLKGIKDLGIGERNGRYCLICCGFIEIFQLRVFDRGIPLTA